ncbi:hypothetical protein NDU88_006742 [Pleurodeles waltl]|uniref:Uncharacterized protein n=1 Tax=Pleurodeles waltl TaxID=8319 RepID=A0AAV7NR36_PLEWA|nr:hypothetical protein NDU88_006742 [Pleurodeles waltl]
MREWHALKSGRCVVVERVSRHICVERRILCNYRDVLLWLAHALERHALSVVLQRRAPVTGACALQDVNPAKEMTGESSRQSKEYFDEFNEYILDIIKDNDLDEFDILE